MAPKVNPSITQHKYWNLLSLRGHLGLILKYH